MTCPCCATTVFRKDGVADYFHWQRCLECGFLVGDVTPPPGVGAGYERLNMEAYDRSIGRMRIEEATRLVALACTRVSSVVSWLDIGCGVGLLIAEARAHGFRVLGIEPDPIARERARSANPGATVMAELGDLPSDAFSVVSMLDVLEHFPADKLSGVAIQVRQNLKNDGLWLIKVPSSEGLFFRAAYALSRLLPKQGWPLMERLWLLRFASPHYVYFNEYAMRRFLESHGFLAIAVSYFPAMPLNSALARLSIDDSIPRWKAVAALPIVAMLNLAEAVFKRSDSLVILATPDLSAP